MWSLSFHDGHPDHACSSRASQAIYIRGLLEVYLRLHSDSYPARLIQSYILVHVRFWSCPCAAEKLVLTDVQYNAILDLASASRSNHYSPWWSGPPADHFTAWGQLAALDVLNSALAFVSSQGNGLRLVTASASVLDSLDVEKHI